MARTIDEVYQSMILSKDSKPSLSTLNKTSSFGIGNSILYVCAVAIAIYEQYQDSYKAEIDDKKSKINSQTSLWWNDKFKNLFQYDPSDNSKGVLSIDDNLNYGYTTTDVTKRIVKFCATSAVDRQVTSKLAKDNGSGFPQQLSSDELQGARSFATRVQNLGTLLNVVSFPPDELKLNIDIYFDAQFGQSTVLDNVKNAIKVYLQNLTFDGAIEQLKLYDAIQAVPGVKDALITNSFAKSETSAFTPFTRIYNTLAGYATLNTTDSIFNMIVQN